MTRHEKIEDFKSKLDSQCNAIVKGIRSAEKRQLTKDLDIGVSVLVELEKAGFKVVRTPRKDGVIPGLRS